MTLDERLFPHFWVAAAGSALLTTVVTTLVLTGSISPEWFFGAPVVAAGVTGVGSLVTAGDRPAGSSGDVLIAAQRFARADQLLQAEWDVRRELEAERRRLVEALGMERELEHLGRATLARELGRVEQRWEGAVADSGRLRRERAVAHADLIVVAQGQGVPEAYDLDPGELIARVLEIPNGQRPGA